MRNTRAFRGFRSNLALRIFADAVCLSVAFAASFFIRFDGQVPALMWDACVRALPWIVLLKLVAYWYAGLYRTIWRYSGINDLVRLSLTQLVGLGVSLFVVTMSREASDGFPRGVFLIDALLSLLMTGGLRFSPRWMREVVRFVWRRAPGGGHPDVSLDHPAKVRRILLVGAGDAGEMVVREVADKPGSGVAVVGFVDDDSCKLGREIHGVRVLGKCSEIARLSESHRVEEIILTMPSASGAEIRAILRCCRGVKARLRITPSLTELGTISTRVTDIRDLRLEDLLRRKEVDLNLNQLSGYLRNKRVLITGAGGSIGSELCLQIARFGPRELLLLGRGEHSIFSSAQELSYRFPSIPRREIIGDVINKRKLEGIFSAYRPEIVFHAGADKHVPLMEMNPDEAVLNNILGTRNLLEVSEAFGVERLVCISTDKVVNPTSVMGCCKRVAEMVLQSRPWKTPSMAVRFGNVLGSRGSVVPTFFEQIRRGGPVTITHPEMTRFFMTIPEAAKLVIQAGALGRGGEIFVLDMGEQVKIADLAREMIQISGPDAERNVQIQFVGIRPGEKLSEELADHMEEVQATDHPKILRIARNGGVPAGLDLRLRELFEAAIAMNYARVRMILSRLVPTYRPCCDPTTATEPAGALFAHSSHGSRPPSPPAAKNGVKATNGTKPHGSQNGDTHGREGVPYVLGLSSQPHPAPEDSAVASGEPRPPKASSDLPSGTKVGQPRWRGARGDGRSDGEHSRMAAVSRLLRRQQVGAGTENPSERADQPLQDSGIRAERRRNRRRKAPPVE